MQAQWQLLECSPGWEGNGTHDSFVVFGWQGPAGEQVIVPINYAPTQSQCHVRLPFADLGGKTWKLLDRLREASYDWNGNDLQSRGLYLDMAPWQASLFELSIVRD